MRAVLRRSDAPWREGWLRTPPAAPRINSGGREPWPGAATNLAEAGAHPLADAAAAAALRRRSDEIESAFGRIEPALRALAPRQFEEGFAARAAEELRRTLEIEIDPAQLSAHWSHPLDLARLHARCVLAVFCRLASREFDRGAARLHEGESAEALIRRFGFHAIDITPCADGRLAGVLDFILRVPPAVVAYRKSYAGALFDVEESLRHWEAVELRRWREGAPNAASEPTRFLKIGVYHFSSVDPSHEGCAAHGSDDARAAGSLLARLEQFAQAVQAVHCCGASVATLLVGVDTDTDAIRVHVPDAGGRMQVGRYVCARELYERTAPLAREAAKEAIRAAVADCAGVAADDAASEGMRWLCGYLLKNNLGQVDAVRRRHGAGYAERGHAERLIVVGDAADDVQLRNLAFQAQMETVEEGGADLEVGLKILGHLHAPRDLAVPVLVHCTYDERIAGARERAHTRAQRLQRSIETRYGTAGRLVVQAVVRPRGQTLALAATEVLPPRGCGCTECER